MDRTDGYIRMEDGVQLYFDKLGSGPTALILLNGFYYLDDFRYLASGRTLISIDLRNRGHSDFVSDASKLKRGIHQDVDDLEAVRRHFGLNRIDLLAHSYAGLIVILYAIKYPSNVNRIVQIGPIPPDGAKQYPASLTNVDATLREFFGKVQELEKERNSEDPVQFCKRFWSILRVIYVANPAHADKIQWELCELPTERNLMKYWLENLMPSIQTVHLSEKDLAVVKSPVLVVHGTKDRSSPYGGAKDWASMLPDATLLTIENAAHVPWIEDPEQVLDPIRIFLDSSVSRSDTQTSQH
jgi:proline iminopeptidase